jgi:hypothetical protein
MGDAGGYYVRVLPGGSPAPLLAHPEYGTVVRLIPECSYAKSSGRLRIASRHAGGVVESVSRRSLCRTELC